MIKQWLGIGLGAFLWMAIAGCASMGSVLHTPSIEVLRIQPEWINPETTKFGIQLKISNSNPLTLSFSGLAYTVTLGTRDYTFQQKQDLPAVPGYAARLTQLVVTLDTPKSWADPSTKPKAMRIRVAGKYTSSSHWLKSSVPFDSSVDFPAQQLPDVSLVGVLSSKKSRKTKLKFKFKNPNSSDLRLDKVRGRLHTSLAGGKLLPPAEVLSFPAKSSGEFELHHSPLDVSRLKPKAAYLLTGELEFLSAGGRMILPIRQKIIWPE